MAIKKISEVTAGIGTIEYNDLQLTPLRKYEFAIEPVFDDAGRTVVYLKHTLSGTWWVTASNQETLGGDVADLRKKLLRAGKTLKLLEIGYGDLTVNPLGGSDGVTDVAHGPKPRVMSISTVGTIAARVEWAVDFHIAECGSDWKNGSLLAFNFSTAISVEKNGLSSRTVSGYWQLAAVQNSEGAISPTAMERITESIVVIPSRFERTSQSFTISPDGSRADFSFTDTERAGAAPPQYMVDAKVNYRVASEDISFSKWRHTISGTIERLPNAPPALAATKFMEIAESKLKHVRRQLRGKGVVIPDRLEFGGDLLGTSFDFSMSFRAVGCIKDIFQASGIYEPLPDSNYELWKTSMDSAWRPGGLAQLSSSGDAVISICSAPGSNPETGTEVKGKLPTITHKAREREAIKVKSAGLFDCGKITKKDSWIAWENKLQYVRKQQVSISKIAQEVGVNAGSIPSLATGGLAGVAQNIGTIYNARSTGTGSAYFSGASITQAKAAPSAAAAIARTAGAGAVLGAAGQVQFQSSPDEYVLMYGKALRVKFPPSIPTLQTIGNKAVALIDEKVEPAEIIGSIAGGCPIFVARWAMLFYVPGGITNQESLKGSENPTECIHDLPFGGF